MRHLAGILCAGTLLVFAANAPAQPAQGDPPPKRFKGNTHTHTLNSDGDSTPQDVVRWYREQRYHFLFLISINRPNFGWATTTSDLADGRGAHLIEIHNGHYIVNNAGGGGQPAAEELWDSMLSAGTRIFAVASDDVHHLKQPWAKASARPGQGWVVVRAQQLTSDAILSALAAGDFYASTGVVLSDVQATPERLTVTVKEETYAKYTIQFIGQGGRLLKEALASPARYDITGGEGYVRAKILDSNGQVAWTQPVFASSR
jgi:hypothetical protein